MIARWTRLAVLLLLVMGAQVRAERPGDAALAGRDSFRIGDSGVMCTAARRGEDDHYASMFDRGYDVLCRDAASPVGKLYVLDGAQRLKDFGPGSGAPCTPEARADAAGLAGLTRFTCPDAASGLQRVTYRLVRRGHSYVAFGLAAYDAALRLGLAALAADRVVPGEVAVAVTGSDDPAALARAQAERFDPDQALAAGIARANDGNHADASAFFDRLVTRAGRGEAGANQLALYLAGQAIQQSNLGNLAQASALFARANKAGLGGDPVFARFYRNVFAMHRLDSGDAAGALATLDAPLAAPADETAFAAERLGAGYVEHALAQRLSLDDATRGRVGSRAQPLSDGERAQLLDAQALYLRGEAHRLLGMADLARRELSAALDRYRAVRGGRVISMAWLPANVFTAQAALAESEGHADQAAGLLQSAIDTLAARLPGSAAWLAARARLAGLQARHGQTDAALATYRALVAEAPAIAGGNNALRGQLGGYFTALLARADQPGSVDDAFAAAQVLVRPGVAQTQAVLARELSGGSDAAADLFRQSLALAREVRVIDQSLATLSTADPAKPASAADTAALAQLTERRAALAAEQTAVQARLAGFARYVAVSPQTVTLADLRKTLRPDEAYYKLIEVAGTNYALWVRPDSARLLRVAASPAELETLVNRTRDSIVSYEGNQIVTNPFDVTTARQIYGLLFGAVAPDMARVHHLIFEPDGAMLKLPATLLISDDAGLDRWRARQALPDADAFDFTGIAWLGRDHVVSTAVSAHAFIDVRKLAPSTAPRRYLGLGQNALPGPATALPDDPCAWPRSTWTHPVSGAELALAARVLGGAGNDVVTGAAFTDSAVIARADLRDFRVIQFATHGLVTAPRPGCAAEPALVTSFGASPSQGLLTFRQIFALTLNADTVILSACDTAGAASADVTRAAGIATGGNFALDGLVRAFVGAGGRGVVASHWPVPDDFDATSRLMDGLFKGGTTTPIGEALRQSQLRLMDDPVTSHPYYWAAFAIVGDAAKPMTTP